MAKYTGIEKYIFSDIYLFFLKYKDIPNEDYYWSMCISDANLLRFKYKNHPFACAMINATMNQLEAIINKKPIAGISREDWETQLSVAKNTPFK